MAQLTHREAQVAVVAARDVHHPPGHVDPDHLESVIGEQAGDATGSTPGVKGPSARCTCESGEPGERVEVLRRSSLLSPPVTDDGAPTTDYHDVSDFGVDRAKRAALYEAQTECAVVWTNREGWPVGVLHRFVWHEERFWVTCAPQRARVAALRARPRSCVIVSSEGTWLGSDITTTAKTMATVHDDDATRAWFYPRLAERLRRDATRRREFLRRLDTSGRVVIELRPVEWITYDGVRLESALRGIPYDSHRVKAAHNRTSPPSGVDTVTFD